MRHIRLAELLDQPEKFETVTVKGWVRTFRANRFIALNDGSTSENLQCVVDFENTDEKILRKINTGAALEISGKLVESAGKGQSLEIVVATMNEKNLISNNKLQTAFKMFDKDGGGSISTDEIKQVLSFGQNLDEKVVNQIIEQVDANGDGEISFEEFAEMMKKAS